MRKTLLVAALLLFAGMAFGQTFHKGGVLSIHTLTITLDPDVTMNQYLDFYEEKFIPEFEKLVEAEVHLAKGLNREIKNQFGRVIYYDSFETFSKYWNKDGSPTEKGTAAIEKMRPLREELQKLGTSTFIVNDWVIL